MRFTTVLEHSGATATGIVVPEEIVLGFGAGKRVPVVVTVNAHSFRSTIVRYNGQYMIAVSAANRAAADVAGGDQIDVTLEHDTAPRSVEVPPDLAAALAGDSVAADYFAGLSYSHQNAYVAWLATAKREETRAARVVKAVEMLHEHLQR